MTLKDEQSRVAAADDQVVFYQLVGDAEIIGIENGKPDDLTPYTERHRQTLDGRAIVYVRAGRMAEEITLLAYTRKGLKAKCTITQK